MMLIVIADIERQLSKVANLSVTYLNSRGVHQFYTQYLNPPPANQTAPDNIQYQFNSGGIFKENQLIINSSIRMGTKLSLFGYYTLNYANSDTSGASSVPSNPFDLQQDYGRASFDVRHRVFVGGSIGLPYNFRLSPFMIATSGAPLVESSVAASERSLLRTGLAVIFTSRGTPPWTRSAAIAGVGAGSASPPTTTRSRAAARIAPASCR